VAPTVSIAVTGGGSGTGIASLFNDTVDMANSSRDISPRELAAAAELGLDLREHVVAIDALAARSDAPVALWGHPYGANCALGAAALTDAVHRLLLYEPSFGLTYPPGTITAVEAALAQGDRETAIVLIFTRILEMTAVEVETLRASPLWPVRLASAPTISGPFKGDPRPRSPTSSWPNAWRVRKRRPISLLPRLARGWIQRLGTRTLV
jgi:hypothetical protein